MVRLSRLGIAVFPCVLLAATSAPALAADSSAPNAKAQVDEQLKALKADLAALRALRQEYRDASAAAVAAASQTFQLTFPDLVHWHSRFGDLQMSDLVVRLRAFNGVVLAEDAHAPQYKPLGFPAEAGSLKVASGKLTGTLNVYLSPDNLAPLVLDLDVAIQGAQASGTYSTAGVAGLAPARSGPVTVTVQEEKPSAVEIRKPDDKLDTPLSQKLYEEAQWVEASCKAAYQDIRAAVIAREYRTSFAHAQKLTFGDIAVYPAIAAEVKTKEKPKPVGKPGKQPAKPVGPKPGPGPSLGGGLEGDLGGLPNESAPQPARAADSPAAMRQVLEFLRPMRERVATYRRSAEAQKVSDGAKQAAAAIVGSETCDDPEFGPWYGEEALGESGGNGNVIAADAGGEGGQSWPWVKDWTCVGPLPRRHRLAETPLLPEYLPSLECGYPMTPYMPQAPGMTVNSPGRGAIERGCGFVSVPFTLPEGATLVKQKIDWSNSTAYAVSSVFAEAEKELWVGVIANDYGKLWINDRLVWVSPPVKNPRRVQETHIFRARFAKGVNRLMFRTDNDAGYGWFSVRACVRGKPRPGEEAKAAAAKVREQQAKAGPPLAGARGWRYDGNGKYPDTAPPIAWDGEWGINVLWRKPLAMSFSTPLVVGEKVFTFEEPYTMVCLNKMDGKELWRRDIDIVLALDKALQAEAEPIRKQETEARAELAKLGPDRKLWRDALVKRGMDAGAADAKLRDLQAKAGSYMSFLMNKCGVTKTAWGNDIGYTYASPVTDGKFIYVKNNTGALACVDLDGNLKWLVRHGCNSVQVGSIPSPLLHNGRVLVFGPVSDGSKGKVVDDVVDEEEQPAPAYDYNQMRAFDAATGKMLWSSKFWSYGAYWSAGSVCGTPIVLRLSNGKETMDVAVTANGTVLRLDDGKVLRSYVGCREQYGSPISDGGSRVVISSNNMKACFELILVDRDNIGVKTLWYNDHPGVFQDGNYGICFLGKLYFSRPMIDVTDLAAGELEWMSGNIFFCRPGRGYPPLAMAGGNLYAADNATWFQPTYRPGMCAYPGAMSVLQPGVPCVVLARNQIEQVHGGFSFEGDRMYVRGKKSLMCYGYTGEAGRAWEAAAVATEILRSVNVDKPEGGAGVTVVATPAGEAKKGGPRYVASGPAVGVPRSWLFAGPLAGGGEGEMARLMSDAAWQGWVNRSTETKVGGKDVEVRVLDNGNLLQWGAEDRFGLRERTGFATGPHIGMGEMIGDFIEVPLLSKPAAGQAAGPVGVAVFGTVLHNEVKRTARFDGSHPNVLKAWAGGVEIRHNQLVDLPAGAVPLVVAVRLDDTGEPFLIRPQFRPSRGSEADAAEWTAYMSRVKPHLERAAQLAPAKYAGRKAKEILGQLK